VKSSYYLKGQTTMTNFEILQMANNKGYRLSLNGIGEWLMIRKSDRKVIEVGPSLQDAEAILKKIK